MRQMEKWHPPPSRILWQVNLDGKIVCGTSMQVFVQSFGDEIRRQKTGIMWLPLAIG